MFTPLADETDLKQVHNASYYLSKGVSDPFDSRAYSGTVVLPKDGEKGIRNSGEVTMFGTVVSGEVCVEIAGSSALISRGASFVVPRGTFQTKPLKFLVSRVSIYIYIYIYGVDGDDYV